MVTAYVKGLQGNNPVYWKTASLMKHFLANSNENNTTSIDQLPPILDYDIRKVRTYMYDRNTPLFPFGYGLTYTSFKYSGLKVEKKVLGEDEIIKITFNIQNTGTYDSEEVAQLYVNYPYSKVERPLKALKGFKRIFIKKGEIAKVSIPLKVADLTF